MSKPAVLFVCVGNSCRSQMAEAFAREAGLDAASAGTAPSSQIHPPAIEAMAELGISMSSQKPEMIDLHDLNRYQRTITMGCGVAESCPTLHTDEDWGLDDPVHMDMEGLRAVRDEIQRRVALLAKELLA